MRYAPILALVAVAALLGWFAQSPPAPAEETPTVLADGSETRPEALREDQWLAGELVLPRQRNGHFYADVDVGSASARMLVDTGASVIALTGEDADMMGVRWDQSEVRPVAKGASGPVLGVPVTLERVQVGQLEARGVEAVVVPEGLDVSLLGQSFLSRIERVEIGADRMVLGG